MAKKGGRVLSVDLSDAEGFAVLPEGPATLTIVQVTEEEGKDSGAPYLKWEFDAVSEDGTKGKVWENTSLQPQALFKLRGLLEALGFEIPDKAMDLDLDDMAGYQCGADIEHEEYKGKPKAKVANYFPIGEEETAAAEPEPEVKKPTAKAGAAKKAAPVEDDAPDEEVVTKKPAKAATKKVAAPDIGDKVSFDGDGEEQIGKVADVDEEKQQANIKVGKEIWTVDFTDLTVL